MDDNIDDLLDDLDALITNKPSSVGTGGGALPFRIPHRPSNEKSPTQQSNPNPKNKFAINPSSSTSSHNHSYNNSYRSGSENVRNQNYPSSSSSSTSSSSGKKDVESIDSLLELLDEPNPQKHMSTSNNHYNSSSNTQHSTSSNTSSYHTSSKGSSSMSSSAFPTFNHSNGTNSSSHKSPPKKQDAHDYCYGNSAISDNSFDSLLSDINSSLPPVSPSNDSLPQAQHSKSASLMKPPPQISTGGAPKGGRCSRVVIAGSEMSRGIKSSAFSKSACDRLRCLKCNFEAIQFPDKAWTSDVDYMFFRNNMPNKSKLTPQLVYKPSSVAYCCQCSWITTQEEVTLSPGQTDKPQWVCAGH